MSGRNPYTKEHDKFLAMYIARYNPEVQGRRGNILYERLVRNEERLWPWAKRHTWQSWRERYLNNRSRLDREIDKYIKLFSKDSQPASSQAPAPAPSQPQPSAPQPPASQRDGRPRMMYTAEDDQNLVEFLAEFPREPLLGQKLYKQLEDTDDFPWAARHPQQSWRERYKKNQKWFDRAIRKYVAGNKSDFEEPEVPKPKTVDDNLPPRRSSQAHTARVTSPAKRKRANEGDANFPSNKRPRVQKDQPVAGPSRSRRADPDREPGGSTDAVQASDVEEPAPVGDEEIKADIEDDEGRETKNANEEDDGEDADDDDDDEGEEDRPLPGSDDYHGEIFESPGRADEAGAAQEDDAQSESDSTQREHEAGVSTNSPDSNAQGEDVAMELDWDDVEVPSPGLLGADEQERSNNDEVFASQNTMVGTGPLLSNTPPLGASPPARKPNLRIERNIDAGPGTPRLSPTEEAEVRHRRERSHSPAPARKHAKRIRRREDDDFFGTPEPTSATTTTQNSPTARHTALIQEQELQYPEDGHGSEGDDDGGPVQREPPRLVEGAWNKAFSDSRGKSRIDPSGKLRRRSGVNFEDEAEIIGVQATPGRDDHSDQEQSEVEATPMQWPPIRSKAKAPVTPMRNMRDKGKARESAAGSSPGSGRLVTTEKIVSVKTVRTVQHMIPSTSKGTPFPRASLVLQAEAEGAPSSPSPQEEDELSLQGEDVMAQGSQHHPFSQQVAVPRTNAPSNSSSAKSGALFPRVDGVQAGGTPIRGIDIMRLQKMLGANRAVRTNDPPQASPSKAERDMKRPRKGPLLSADRARLAGMLKKPALRPPIMPPPNSILAGASLSRATISPPGAARDDSGERFDAFEERDQELPVRQQSSPLADKGDPRPDAFQVSTEVDPQIPASRAADEAQQQRRVDKGKARAGAFPILDGHARRNTLGGPMTNDVFDDRAEGNSSFSLQRQLARQSLPHLFAAGEGDLSTYRSALSLAFHPPPSGSGYSRFFRTLSAAPAASIHAAAARSSRSVSPAKPANASLADALPPHELEMVKELGMQTALHVMARNHGFSEETVRQVYAETCSLEAADHVLREMRDSANEKANEALASLFDDGAHKDEDGDGDEDEDEGGNVVDEDAMDVVEGGEGSREEEEVENVLGEDSWLQDEMPFAESSRADAAMSSTGIVGSNPRKRQQLRIQRLRPEQADTSLGYSPPKHSRAALYVKRGARSIEQDRHDADAIDVDARVRNGEEGIPWSDVGHTRPKPSVAGFGQLMKYNVDQWRDLEKKYGPGAAKVTAGKALAKLLNERRQAS